MKIIKYILVSVLVVVVLLVVAMCSWVMVVGAIAKIAVSFFWFGYHGFETFLKWTQKELDR